MMDLSVFILVVWVGCFVVVAVDAAYQKTSPWFWRWAALFGGPIALAVYAWKREK